MRENATLDPYLRSRYFPRAGCGRDHHLTRGRSGLTISVERRGNGGRAAGALHRATPDQIAVKLSVSPSAIGAHLRPVRAELLRNQCSEPVIWPLPHLQMGRM